MTRRGVSDVLVQQCYQEFVRVGIINPKYVTVEECKSALIHGCRYHQGKGEVNRFMKKSLKKMNHPRSQKTHVGTLSKLDAIIAQKVQAEQAAYQRRVAEAAAAEKQQLLQGLAHTRQQIQTHQTKISDLNQTIDSLHALQEENKKAIHDLNERLSEMKTHLNLSTAENEALVNQITSLQTLLIENQRMILRQLASLE
jgi:chromosome segregation ATPase